MLLFNIFKCITLNVLLFVQTTNTQLLKRNRDYGKDNNIPVDIYKTFQALSRSQNSNEDVSKKVLDVLIKEIINAENRKNRDNRCINVGNVYEIKVNRIVCRDVIERNNLPKVDHSGRTRHNTQQPWTEYEIPFIGLTKNDVNAFSKDYIDVDELARTDLDRFSKDYLDVDDLARRNDRRSRGLYAVEIYPTYFPPPGKIFDIFNSRKAITQNRNAYINKSIKKRRGRYKDESSDTTDSSSEELDESGEDLKRNRFKIISHKEYSVNTSEEESSLELPVQKEKTLIKDDNRSESEEGREESRDKPEEYFVYTQGRNRIINGNDIDRRKRLEHFMPKRFHWDEDEFRNLGYYWFNGHRGRYAEAWRPGAL